MMNSVKWTECSRAHPCRACEHADWCGWCVDDEGNEIIRCMRSDVAPAGFHKVPPAKGKPAPSDGATVFRQGAPPVTRQQERCEAWRSINDRFRAELTATRRQELADRLTLPVDALGVFPFGWCSRYKSGERWKNTEAWTCPRLDRKGAIVAIDLRPVEGKRFQIPGSKNESLFIPHGLDQMKGPILAVEGYSDVCAAMWCGVRAVGRSSNLGSVETIAALYRDEDLIVVGEFDPKMDGKWPGLVGARTTAAKLALQWGRRVRWAMVPDGARHKDVREWVAAQLADGDDRMEVGSRLVRLIRELSQDAEAEVSADGQRPSFSNVNTIHTQKGRKHLSLPLPVIRSRLHQITGGWPKRIGDALFIVNRQGGLHTIPERDDWRVITRSDELFAFVYELAEPDWASRRDGVTDSTTGDPRTPPSKGEFHRNLVANTTPVYQQIECFPHHPPMPGTYYLPFNPPRSDGSALMELLSHLNAESEMDRALMRAAILTLFWGGACGKRPAIVFTSAHGRGVGKTRTANLFADLAGGCITISEDEDWERVRTRLLTIDALANRVVLIDNVRGRLARSGLEAALTAHTIDGHRLNVGQASRPNNLTWLITANTPQLSRDLTDRAVVIKLGEQKHGSAFERWVTDFMQNRHAELVSECITILREGAKCEIPRSKIDRWGPWIDAVLATDPEAEAVLEYLHGVRPSVDSDLKEAESIRSVINAICGQMGLDPDLARITIHKQDLREWLVTEGIFEKKWSPRYCSNIIEGLLQFEPLKHLSENPGRTNGRAWLWVGANADLNSPTTHYQLSHYGTARPSDAGRGGQPMLPNEPADPVGDDDFGFIPV